MKSFFIKLITIKIIALITLSFYFLNLDETYAAINQQINYQGRLLDDIGDSVTDGSYDIDFALYTVSTGGSPVWTETQTATTRDGLFSVMLGSVSSLGGVDFNQTLYLGINVEADGEMTPRKILGAVPAAFVADTVDGISSEQFFRNDIANSTSSSNTFFTLVQNGAGKLMELFGSGMKSLFTVLSNGNVGIGTTSPSTLLEISGSNPIFTFDNTESSSHDYQIIVRGGVGQPNRFDVYNRTSGTTMFSIDDQMFMIGTTSNPIGNSSRMFVWGGPSGANIDVMGEYASGKDQAVLELQSGDFESSFQSSAFRHFGSLSLGSTLGFSNNSGLGVLDFTDVTAIIKTTFDDPIIFGINNGEVARFSDTGNFGLGTTTPSEKLSVDGSINLTGALKSNGDAGTSGYVLQTTGSSVQWVATSSLGIVGGLADYGIGDAVTSGTAGSILYIDSSGNLAQDNSRFYYDSATGYLGLGTSTDSIVIGRTSGDARGENAIEIATSGGGWTGNSVASGNNSILIGSGRASGDSSIAIGNSASSLISYGVAIGGSAYSNGWNTVAIGYEAIANDGGAVAIGMNAFAYGQSSVAIGPYTQANATNSSAFGQSLINDIANSTMIGPSQDAAIHILGDTGEVKLSYITASSTASSTLPYVDTTDIGIAGGLYDNSASSGVSGYVLQSTGTGLQWVATSTLGISGGGGMAIGGSVTGGTNGSILYIDTLGNLAQNNSYLRYKSDGGIFLASSLSNVDVGNNTIEGGNVYSSSFYGFNNNIHQNFLNDSYYLTVIGNSNDISSDYSMDNLTVVGSLNTITNIDFSNVFGTGNSVSGPYSTVIGNYNNSSGFYSILVGNMSYMYSNYSNTLGYLSGVASNSHFSTALGYRATVGINTGRSTAVGYYVSASAQGASIFGGGGNGTNQMINNIANSTMIGPTATSSIRILNTGEVRLPYFTATSTTATSTIAGNLQVQNTLQVGTSSLYLTDNNITSTGNLTINSNGVAFNLPTSQGGSGYVLQNNGSGNLTWVATTTLGFAEGGGMEIGNAVTSGTGGSVLFVDGSGNLGQSNSQFNWNNTNNSLSLGTSSAPTNSRLNISGGNITHTAGSNPVLKGVYDTLGDYAADVQIVGKYAYVGTDNGLFILDISNPSSPSYVGTYSTFAYNIFVSGKYAYIADGISNFYIIDVSNPASPSLVGDDASFGAVHDIYVSGGIAYLVSGDGLKIVDVSNPSSLREVGEYSGSMGSVYVSGKYAYVVDGGEGFQIIDISNPASPSLVGTSATISNSYEIQVTGNYAYVATGVSGLAVFNISNPASPSLVGTYNTPGEALGVRVAGRYAYVSDDTAGLQVIDISDPTSPTSVGVYDTPGNASAVYVSGKYAYVADGTEGLHVVDINGLETPAITTGAIETDTLTVNNNVYVANDLYAGGGITIGSNGLYSQGNVVIAGGDKSPTLYLVGTYDTPGNARGVDVSGNYAYVADNTEGLQIIDISNPLSPSLTGSYNTPGESLDVKVSGNHAYVADWGATGIQVINIANPASPSLTSSHNPGRSNSVYIVGNTLYTTNTNNNSLGISNILNPSAVTLAGSYSSLSNVKDVHVSGNYAYVADGSTGLHIIDISNPASPSLVGSYDTAGSADGVQVVGNYAYIADNTNGLVILNISNPASPSLVSTYGLSGNSQGIHVVGKYAFIANGDFRVVDISNPASPSLVGSYNATGFAYDVKVVGNYAYIANGTEGLQVIDISELFNPVIAGSSLQIGNTYFSDEYLNFSEILGYGGFGIRNNAGVIEIKNAAGNWSSIVSQNDIATSSSPVAFSVHRNGTPQTVTVNTYVRVDWTHEHFDANNNFDLINDRFTPTVAGYYQLNAAAYCNSSTSCFVAILKNGSTQATDMIAGAGGSGSAAPSASALTYMNGTTDYVHVFVYSSNASVSGSFYTNFSGVLVSGGDGGNSVFNQAGNYTPTGTWDFTNATVYGIGGSGGGDKHAIIVDQKTQGTNGGTFTAGAWRIRDLNTKLQDNIGVTVSSNQFTLPAGNYKIHASAPAYNTLRHQARLYNVTDGTVAAYGTSAFSRNSSAAQQSNSEITHNFTISSTKTFQIEHSTETTVATNGFGVASNFAGAPEIYTVVDITQFGGGESVLTKVGNDAYFNGGNIGIGTSTPQRLLHVYRSDDGPPVRFQDSNGYCEINPTSTTWTCTSDERLKENIVAISSTTPDLYDKMRLLRPVTFEWRTDETNTERIGLIAQEVEAVFPEFVITDEETGLKSVSYGSFIPYILSMLQHIANRLDELVGDALHFAGGIITKLTIGSAERPTGITMFDEVTGEAYCLTIKNGDVHTKFGECPFEEDENSNPHPIIYSTSVEDDDDQDIFFGGGEENEEYFPGDEESTTTPEVIEEDPEEEITETPEDPGMGTEPEQETETPVDVPSETEAPVEPDVIVETIPSSGSVEINL